MIALPLVVDSKAWDSLFEMVFSWVPPHPPQSLEPVFGMLMMPFLFFYGYSFMIGSAIITLLIWFATRKWMSVHPCALEPLLFPVLSLLWLVVQALPFLQIATGTPIRPMGWALYTGLSALGLMIVSIVRTIGMFKKGMNKVVCLLATLVSAVLIAAPSVSLNAIARFKGLILEP